MLFVAGCIANQAQFYSRFDSVVLLSAPSDVVLARVANRTNPFGSTAAQREEIASDLVEFEPLLRAAADIEVDTTVPLATVVNELERVAGFTAE